MKFKLENSDENNKLIRLVANNEIFSKNEAQGTNPLLSWFYSDLIISYFLFKFTYCFRKLHCADTHRGGEIFSIAKDEISSP